MREEGWKCWKNGRATTISTTNNNNSNNSSNWKLLRSVVRRQGHEWRATMASAEVQNKRLAFSTFLSFCWLFSTLLAENVGPFNQIMRKYIYIFRFQFFSRHIFSFLLYMHISLYVCVHINVWPESVCLERYLPTVCKFKQSCQTKWIARPEGQK